MRKVFLNTNIIIDLVLDREGADNAELIFQQGEDGIVSLNVSFLTMANAAYIIKKGHTKEELNDILKDLASMLNVLPMDGKQFNKALEQPASDFEDMLQYICAKQNNCDCIITRNGKHFSFQDIEIFSPSEWLNLFHNI